MVKRIKSELMEVVNFSESGDLHLRTTAKVNRQMREIRHHFRVTPFEENLKALKPGKWVMVTLEISEE